MLGGASASGIRLTHEERETHLDVSELSLDLSMLGLATNRLLDAEVDLTFPKGSVEGARYHEDGKTWTLEIEEFDQIDLKPFFRFMKPKDDPEKPLDQRWPVILRGQGSGSLKLSGAKRLSGFDALVGAKGSFQLTLSGVVLEHLILSSKDQWGNPQALELRNVRLGTIQLELVADVASKFPDLKRLPKKQHVIVFKRLEVDGADLELITDGRPYVKVRRGKFELSDVSLAVLVRLKPSLFTRTARIDGKKETPNSWLKTVLEMDKRAKNAYNQGYYGVRLSGIISRLKPTPYKPLIRGEIKRAIDDKKARDQKSKADKHKKAQAIKKGEADKKDKEAEGGAGHDKRRPGASKARPGAEHATSPDPIKPRPALPTPRGKVNQHIEFKGARPEVPVADEDDEGEEDEELDTPEGGEDDEGDDDDDEGDDDDDEGDEGDDEGDDDEGDDDEGDGEEDDE